MDKSLNTVMLDSSKCKGCVSCMKRCPTEAIRVRDGKAKVIYDRCIGCAECVRVCPHQAKLPAYDSFDIIHNYKYKIALPAPSLYGQFQNLDSIDRVLNGLLAIGFDDVYEVSSAAELVTEASHKIIAEGKIEKPIISSACPAVLELIIMAYHGLKDHIIDTLAPVDVAARLARERAIAKGIPSKDIGVFFISPCPAKVFALKMGLGLKEPSVDGVLATSEIYFKLANAMSTLDEIKPIAKSGYSGVYWASSGGEAIGTGFKNYLAADGMENVVTVLKDMEDGKLNYIDFVELNACPSGCVGGVLNIENPFVARARLRLLRQNLPKSENSLASVGKDIDFYRWEEMPKTKDVFKLDENRLLALQKLDEIEKLLATLPLLDCGSCGAPSCRAFAEDVINGVIDKDGCVRKNENH
ncbi:MAG: 4Fe-4S binding protein [Clostridiales bacterium]|nr:4Fe-4S binding protein [Clostridiales bacterium]